MNKYSQLGINFHEWKISKKLEIGPAASVSTISAFLKKIKSAN